jgi:hypothetical protein
MAPKFKMDVKTFLLVKTCKFSFFFNFLLDCLNFVLSVFLRKLIFLEIQNGRKIQAKMEAEFSGIKPPLCILTTGNNFFLI